MSIIPARSVFLLVGATLRQRRELAGYSLEGLAERCQMHQARLGGIERGERGVSIPTLHQIAQGLGVSLGQLLTEVESPGQSDEDSRFRQQGLVDQSGHPFASRDERSRLLVSDLALANDALLRRLDQHPTEIYQLAAREFEELVAETLARQGYDVTLTPIAKDGGKDIFVASHSALGSALYVVECKRYSPDRPVGVGIVRELYGVIQAERLTGGIVATTSYFTADVRQFTAPLSYQLSLADFHAVRSWIRLALMRHRKRSTVPSTASPPPEVS
jgi:transcriptional regulator with XRE-family HTH domain